MPVPWTLQTEAFSSYAAAIPVPPRGCHPVVYHDSYNMSAFGLEKLHSFDSVRYRKVFNALVADKIISSPSAVLETLPLEKEELEAMHSAEYLKQISSSFGLMKVIETPILCVIPYFLLKSFLVRPMQLATKGTIMAAHHALFGKNGFCLNIGGGYHHANRNRGHGFCLYADITAAAMSVRARAKASGRLSPVRVLIVDLDAHRGDGHELDFLEEVQHGRETGRETVHIFDCYTRDIFPGDEDPGFDAIGTVMHFSERDDGKRFLGQLRTKLSAVVRDFKPDLCIYNAGTDILEGDPLSGLNITAKNVVARDEVVFECCGYSRFAPVKEDAGEVRVTRRRGTVSTQHFVPVAMVLSGGYQNKAADVISASFRNLQEKFGLFDPSIERSN